ncbi:MAG: cytochrome c biogenesis protein CcsA [Bacteroidia bacterium]|nr:cytochrome c biogenesis protein CcsA [Bacteroidia bacterium]
MKNWWKILGVLLVLYSIIGGFLIPVPAVNRVSESIRNLYFHVPMWFAMIVLATISVIYSVIALSKSSEDADIKSSQSASAAIPFALIGLITGSIWAKFTWGNFWTNDPKLNGVAASLLIYLAYFVLRSSIADEQKKARISSIYNIFAYVMMIVFILIIPRFVDSLHPGNGGNMAFGKYDLDNNMRTVFYPACIGWILMGVWFTEIRVRTEKLKRKYLYGND